MKVIKQPNADLGFPYIALAPDKLSKNPALIIQLHGAGERGHGQDELDRVLAHGLSHIVNDDNLKDCILVMPQCPVGTFWVAKIESLKKFIDAVVQQYAVDPTRIYLCGLSMGGFGTWYTAMAYPELFAAIAPCCGGGMAWNARVLTMPVWTFHGLEDSTVSPHQTIEMIEALKPINSRLRYDLYEGVGHDSWEKAFTAELLEWFYSYRK